MENLNYSGVISFGEFKNIEWHQRSDDKLFLTVVDSDNFREIENNWEFKNCDCLTERERKYFDGKVNELAEGISNYLNNIGIESEIYDDPIGYGQEIINLVVAINKKDYSRIK